MALFAIDLNDAAITVVGRDGIALAEPGYVPGYAATVDGRLLFGMDAWKESRLHPRSTANGFWGEFSEEPLAREFAGCASSADLAHAHLEALLAGLPSRPSAALIVVPPNWTTRQLGLLLGIAEDIGLPIRGLVDPAVAATRGEYAGHRLLQVDSGLHSSTITRLDQDGRVSLGDRQVVERIGISQLERACAAFIAGRFLQATRFDPAHDARSEQYLYDNLYAWIRDVNRQEEIGLTIEFGANEFCTTMRRADLSARIADAFEPVARQIRSSVSSGEQVAIQVSARLAEFPGVVEALAKLPQASVFVLEQAAGAIGALQREQSFAPTGGGVGLTTTLPWDRAVAVAQDSSVPADFAPEVVEPTHVFYGGNVYRLTSAPFSIGVELAAGEYGLQLGASLGGVSRRHCSIRRGQNGVELADHSRFGTKLNGHAIDGAVVLQAGDIITIGSPPVQLRLVREVGTRD
jgi:hypothetical protein